VVTVFDFFYYERVVYSANIKQILCDCNVIVDFGTINDESFIDYEDSTQVPITFRVNLLEHLPVLGFSKTIET